MKSILLCSYIFLLCQTARGFQLPFGRNFNFDSSHSSTPKVVEEPDIFASGSSEIFNSSVENRTENGSEQPLSREDISVLTNQNNSESTSDGQSSITNSTSSGGSDATTNTQTSAAVFGNESQSQNLSQPTSSVLYNGASQDTNSSETSNVTLSSPSNESSEAEQEGVARGKPSTTDSSIPTSTPQSLYQKTWTLISDTYTLSILVPVAAGVVFATTIILTIAFCRCMRRCCIRRRLRKKVLPDSVKNLRPSDRARLLAESSDDEF